MNKIYFKKLPIYFWIIARFTNLSDYNKSLVALAINYYLMHHMKAKLI